MIATERPSAPSAGSAAPPAGGAPAAVGRRCRPAGPPPPAAGRAAPPPARCPPRRGSRARRRAPAGGGGRVSEKRRSSTGSSGGGERPGRRADVGAAPQALQHAEHVLRPRTRGSERPRRCRSGVGASPDQLLDRRRAAGCPPSRSRGPRSVRRMDDLPAPERPVTRTTGRGLPVGSIRRERASGHGGAAARDRKCESNLVRGGRLEPGERQAGQDRPKRLEPRGLGQAAGLRPGASRSITRRSGPARTGRSRSRPRPRTSSMPRRGRGAGAQACPLRRELHLVVGDERQPRPMRRGRGRSSRRPRAPGSARHPHPAQHMTHGAASPVGPSDRAGP
jgi:hypothetical protein